ncbi:MAG: S-layer homology domain-containing protein, partial [Oscillospiraceae bacterium]|nr:S-layer homology domain-containing protein [Oscillospiraceae bacterium]
KPATATFTDSASHWALEYIEYCANLGIIAGRSATTFDPEGKVTAAEAAKMILVALGFDADVFGLVGANWSQNTITLASNLLVGDDVDTAETLNLFNGLSGVTANTPLTRDQAAQLIYNGITANTVKMALTGVTAGTQTGILGGASGQTPTYSWTLTGDPLLKSKFNAEIKTAVMTSAKYTKATKTAEAYWTYKIGDASYVFAEDVSDLFRQSARVIYRKLSGNRTSVLAITSAGNGVVETCAFGDLAIPSSKATLNGYDLAANGTDEDGNPTYHTTDTLPVYMFLNTASGKLSEVKKGTEEESQVYTTKAYDEAKLIDHNGDGRIDCVVVTEVKYTTVGGIRPTYIQLRGVTSNVMLAGNNVPEDLVTGEYVTYTTNPETGVITVEKAEIVNGTLAATMDAKAEEGIVDSVRVNGNWYTVIENYATGANIKGMVGDEVNLVLVAGYVVAGEKVTASTTSSAAVLAVAQAEEETENKTTVNGSTKYLEIRVLKADNTYEDLKVTKVDNEIVAKTNDYTKVLYTYSADSSAAGCVTLKTYAPIIEGDEVEGQKVANWDFDNKSLAAFNVKGGQITDDNGTYRIAADGTFFVLTGNGKYAALKGADIAKWYSQNGYDATGSVVYANRSANGFIYAQTGAIILESETAIPGATGKALYHGFVTGNARYTIENRASLIEVTVWNGTENVLVKAKTIMGESEAANAVATDTTKFTIGTLVSYLDNGDGTANELTALTETVDAVKAWDGESVIKFYNEVGQDDGNDELTIDNNTVVLFMDGTTGEGVANGNITLGDWVDPFDHTKGQYANVLYVAVSNATAANTNDHVDVLILETNSRIYDEENGTSEAPYMIFGADPTTPDEGDEPTECEHESISKVEATATACEHYKCDNTECGQLFSDEAGTTEIDEAPEHTPGSWAANATTNTTHEKKCTVCETVLDSHENATYDSSDPYQCNEDGCDVVDPSQS